MANKTISIDFEKIFKNIGNYFKNLTTDMIIAYAVLGVGIVALIIALVL
jgi:flagellar biosynthesis/type III secretory pathway M-ring protein FliF/YscJ